MARKICGDTLTDRTFGKWIGSYRRQIGLPIKQAESLAKLPDCRLYDIESGKGHGITKEECVRLALLYKMDAGQIMQKATGVAV